jgi:hypothetical protein
MKLPIIEDYGIEIVELARTDDSEKFLIRHRVAIRTEGSISEKKMKEKIYDELSESLKIFGESI